MNFSALHEKLNQYINKGRLKSPWVVHYDCGSCNGCDIEVLACLTPVFDVERFGIVNIGDPKHADVLLVTGTVNQRNKDVLKNLYDQMPEPKAVIAIGACACTGGVFQDCYNVVGGVDHVIPVSVLDGDCWARTKVRFLEVLQSMEIVRQAISHLPDTEINVKVKGNPSGEVISRVEQPRGECMYYVKGNGSKYLDRVRIRTPTFANIPPLLHMVKGIQLADVPVVVLSIDPCISCTER